MIAKSIKPENYWNPLDGIKPEEYSSKPIEDWTTQDFWTYWILTEDVKSMIIYEYQLEENEYPTNSQCEFIRQILFGYSKRMLLNWFTRAGKSMAVGWLMGLYIIINQKKRINVIGPQWSQTHIIRKYFTSALARSRTLKHLLQTKVSKEELLNTEVSKQRMTFFNGCEVNTLGVQGEGNAAMGEGGDLNIVDEMGLIDPGTYRTRVDRMLGDDVEESILIGLFNPWSQDTIAYDLWVSGSYDTMHVDWRQGLKEGRLTDDYIKDKKTLLEPMEFEVLFESRFPKNTIDVIMTPEQVKEAINRKVKPIIGRVEIGCDVARFGSDKTTIVVRSGYCCWYLKKYQGEDTQKIANRIGALIDKYIKLGYSIIVNVDDTGVGGGVVDRLREDWEQEGITIIGVQNGGKASNEMYYDRATEIWFWMKDNIHLLQLPEDSTLIKQFSSRKYKYVNKGVKRLESKDDMKKRGLKSPDEAEGVAYAFASETNESFEIEQPVGGFM